MKRTHQRALMRIWFLFENISNPRMKVPLPYLTKCLKPASFKSKTTFDQNGFGPKKLYFYSLSCVVSFFALSAFMFLARCLMSFASLICISNIIYKNVYRTFKQYQPLETHVKQLLNVFFVYCKHVFILFCFTFKGLPPISLPASLPFGGEGLPSPQHLPFVFQFAFGGLPVWNS